MMADSDKTNYFDMFAKMANPGGLPFQNLFFSPLDKEAITKKIGELETVRTWLQTSLGVLDASVKALEFQLSMLEKAQKKAADFGLGGDASTTEAHDGETLLQQAAKMANPSVWGEQLMSALKQAAHSFGVDNTAAEAPVKPKSAPKRPAATKARKSAPAKTTKAAPAKATRRRMAG
jgi:hypothetical protein